MRIAKELTKWVALLAVLAALTHFSSPVVLGDPATEQEPSGPAYGQLNVGTDLVISLTVVDESGKYRVIDWPGKSVELPAGEYRLEEVVLQNSFEGARFAAEDPQVFEISPDKPHQLRIDGLLKPTVTVTRQGRLLELDYALMDADGAAYSHRDDANPPRFTVYKDGQVIDSGSFEYG